ncbi:multidrug efflux SMR transporter [Campylobacter upsaliensis]|uniref:DMT family transporter n=1 Tax=Campylobacter upsaliensis TaxID=28080 RepID=UPI000E205EAF|nr:multidrug efflux SMR transporter [Campylobacter upsaliensis]EAI4344878.1 multidrug efflux SMR transporter [Campylobacter upsaliensis]TXE69583.1 multidrug efflux SMR transporter [Campylobacter upsaliensis]CAG9468753.1 multidrug efflux SMR transporter [Campylobacter upsaliensis]
MLKAWIFLMLAIVCEVFGVSVMNYSQEGNQIFVYGFMFAMIGVAYYFMSLSIRTISVGVAYAIWEIVGLSLITLIAVFIFDASLKTQEYIGLALAIVGIVLVNLGEKHEDEKEVENV